MIVSTGSLALFVAAFILVGFVYYVYLRLFSPGPLPDVLPWVGVVNNGAFSRARATLKSVTNTRELLQEGYYKYSKKGLPFILPNILTGPEVVLPLQQMEWLLQQPNNVLDQNEVNRQFLQADYTMLHPKVVRDTVHGEVIRSELTKNLGGFLSDAVEEVDLAFKDNWGVDSTEWKEVPVHATISAIIGKLSNRVLVGVPLCRNDEYVENSMKFSRGIVITAGLIGMTPKILKPLFAPIFTLYDKTFYWKCAKYIVPIVQQRTSAPVSDNKDKNDYVQWAINHAATHHDPAERGSDMISKRLAVLTFTAIQSCSITLTNLIFDLAASPLGPAYLSTMRDDVSAELAAEHGTWTKAGLARMISLDSLLRESMRLWGFGTRGVLKLVVKKEGVRLPSGLHLPFGTKLGCHAYPIHHDEDFYVGAYKFDPFRSFNEENGDAEGSDFKQALRLGEKRKGTSLVTTSPTFMAFSHGRNACPGRFFASQHLKVTLAYIALNYEIKQIPTRPVNQWFVSSSGPPLDATICIRRRVGTA